MNQWYRVSIKMQYEGGKGQIKFKKENFVIYAVSPSDVESKLAKHLGVEDYEIVAITLTNIVDIIK